MLPYGYKNTPIFNKYVDGFRRYIDMSTPRILLGFSCYQNPVDVATRINSWLSRIRAATGIQVDSFCLTLNPPGPKLSWEDLDKRWKVGDRKLLKMYEDLARKLENYDVFLNYNGINLHPEFVQQLTVFRVYACFDDPESSEDLSKPVASSYDLCLVGNIAEVETYKKWGVKEAKFWPLGFFSNMYNPSLTKEDILNNSREVDIALLCERQSKWRIQDKRIDTFVSEFPKGHYYGKGWPSGFLEQNELVPLYQKTRIGPNFHLSTGPINLRTYTLPANGVLQICDNKSHLNKIFQVGKEVIGFDSVQECIELCRYYLSHEKDCRQIAAAGWERAIKDYNEVAVFQRFLKAVQESQETVSLPDHNVLAYLARYRKQTFLQSKFNFLKRLPLTILYKVVNLKSRISTIVRMIISYYTK